MENRHQGKRVTVMGLGSFGGGAGAVRFFSDRGANVVVSDLRSESELAESIGQIADCRNVILHLGHHSEKDFVETDLVVVNPAVRPGNRFVELARHSGIPLTTEISLFCQHNRGHVIAITGSNGKSTTTALIHSILQAACESAPGPGAADTLVGTNWRCWLGGNIGQSLLPEVDHISSNDWVVLELSSFQLFHLNKDQFRPDVAVVTNFAPNHLDWHDSINDYRDAKQSILRWQSEPDFSIVNADDDVVCHWNTNGTRLLFGASDHGHEGAFCSGEDAVVRFRGERRIIPVGELLKIPGDHNSQNALAAICATTSIGVKRESICDGIQRFDGLPHRLQFVAEVNDRTFYNDSIATTPESVAVAMDSFSCPVLILAGGYDKKLELNALAAVIANRSKAVALIGETGPKLEELISRIDTANRVTRKTFESLEAAFDWAVAESAAGDVVLLSPGCASYDWFQNFEERGKRFVELVNRLKKQEDRNQGTARLKPTES